MTQPPPLCGLILAGGASARMHQDKAALIYDRQPQLLRAYALVNALCPHTSISVRPDQTNDPIRADLPQIIDRLTGQGPIAGILAAQSLHPEMAWLIVACDLPFLNSDTLQYLIAQRDPSRLATAYRSARDGLPEPLCAIYEPQSHEPLARYAHEGGRCPRKFLVTAGSDVCLLDPQDSHALDNVNTAEEYAQASAALGSGRRRVQVRYHALLREQAGCSNERLTTNAATPAALYEEVRARHAFTLERERLRVAVNAEFADWAAPIQDGDEVVFIPPVSGG